MSDEATDKRPPARRYRGKTKHELRAERRERLLEAATELFATEGYANVSIERICTTARVANRHFYEHFRSREALLAALFDAFTEDGLSITLGRLPGPNSGDALELAIGALHGFTRFCLDNPARARVALIETVGVSPEMEARRRAMIRRFAQIIASAADRLAEDGIIPQADYQLPAIALVGATNELLTEWLSGSSGRTAEQMERQIVAIFRAIIQGARLQAESE